MVNTFDAYQLAQRAIADLKSSVLKLLIQAPSDGMKNAEIGRSLGIYGGHVGHEGHISRTILAQMEIEGVVEQNKETKKWTIKNNSVDVK